MPAASFNRDLLSGVRGAFAALRPRDADELEPRLRSGKGGGKRRANQAARMTAKLDARMKRPRATPGLNGPAAPTFAETHASDPRQRAVVKVHYFTHAGGGGAALRAHGSYIERESARLDRDGEGHANYLSRDGREGFYGPAEDRIDGRAQLAEWAKEDGRHFRLILSPENGQALGDLTGYTREVMARAQAELGRPLQWVAVNHWDTDNPHTHIVLRGRDGEGRPLTLPDQFIKHRLREIARDVASERLGPRTPADERRSLEREVRAFRVTRLDRMIADRLDERGGGRMADLARGVADPDLAQAMKARAQTLVRMGLATESARGALMFAPDWQDRLKGLEAHVDIRRQMFKDRADGRSKAKTEGRDPAFEKAAADISREAGKPYRGLGETKQRWTVRGEVEISGGRYLALERHDRVALAIKPPGLDVAAGQKVIAQMKDGLERVTRALGIER
jgi:type IV secretory pathway VirD2 relaxase